MDPLRRRNENGAAAVRNPLQNIIFPFRGGGPVMRRSSPAALVAFTFLFCLVGEPAAGQDAGAGVERAATAWKPFQEFGFLTGAWSGTAESGSRVGGRVSRWSLEMG